MQQTRSMAGLLFLTNAGTSHAQWLHTDQHTMQVQGKRRPGNEANYDHNCIHCWFALAVADARQPVALA